MLWAEGIKMWHLLQTRLQIYASSFLKSWIHRLLFSTTITTTYYTRTTITTTDFFGTTISATDSTRTTITTTSTSITTTTTITSTTFSATSVTIISITATAVSPTSITTSIITFTNTTARNHLVHSGFHPSKYLQGFAFNYLRSAIKVM